MRLRKHFFAFVLNLAAMGWLAGQSQAAPFDQQFIDSMVPHHQSAVVMAQMAVKQARFPEVRQMARGIIRDQQKEIAHMQSWRKAWFGSAEVPPMPGMEAMSSMPEMSEMQHGSMKMSGDKMMPGKMMMSGVMMGLPMKGEMDMDKLMRAHGRDFDRMFLQMMIPHHCGAVMMADEALKVTGRAQLRTLSNAIISSQAREIGQMQGILDRRFGRR